MQRLANSAIVRAKELVVILTTHLLYHLKTSFLLTESDVKAIVIPTVSIIPSILSEIDISGTEHFTYRFSLDRHLAPSMGFIVFLIWYSGFGGS